MVMQILGSNPTILHDKRTKNVFYKMLDLIGVNPHDLGDDPTPDMATAMMPAQVGGSIARPQAQPMQMNNQQTTL